MAGDKQGLLSAIQVRIDIEQGMIAYLWLSWHQILQNLPISPILRALNQDIEQNEGKTRATGGHDQ
jgi:hypothetical protein